MTGEQQEHRTVHDRVLAQVHAALDDAHALGLTCLDVDELEAFTCQTLRIAERARALAATAVAEADHARVAPRNGIASLTARLAATTGGPTAAIAPSRTLGLWLDTYPHFRAAWADGRLTEAHIRQHKTLDTPPTRLALIRDQHVHIDNAATLDFTDWLNTLSYWLLHANPDGTLPTDRTASYGIRTRLHRNTVQGGQTRLQ